jgi:tetratricopeptide (TPR) repeat protein
MARLAQQYRLPVFEWNVALCEAMFALMDGRLSEAERLVHAAGQRAKTKTFSHFFQLFALGRFQGRFDPSVTTRIDEFLSWKINYDGLLHAALLALESGNVDAAREQFDALAMHEFRDVLVDIAWLSTVVQSAEVAAWLGDRERSALLYDMLAPFADWCVTFSGGSTYYGAVGFYLSLLATTLERWEDAEGHFERAIELDTANCARPFVANAQYHYADMLVRRDSPGNRERALALVDQALSAAEEMGMAPLSQRALELKVRVQGILKA